LTCTTPGVDAPGEREPALVVARDDPGGQPVAGGVGDRHRLVGVLDRLGDEHRAEGLLGVDARPGRDVGQDGGAVARPVARAPGEEPGARRDGVIDIAGDPGQRGRGDQRPDHRQGIGRVAGRQRLGPGGEPVDKRVVDRPLDEDLPRVHADLPGVEERGERGGLDRVVQVGVGEHDERVVPAKLKDAALQRPARALGENPAGGRGAGEVDAPDLGPVEELVRDRDGLARRVRDDVQHAGREAGILQDLRDQQPGRYRGLLRRLEHHGVAEGQRVDHGAPGENLGAVPRRDAGDHAERAAQRQRERSGDVGPDHLPGGQVGPVGGLPQQPDRGQHLEPGEAGRAARLGGEQRDDLVPAPLYGVGGAQE
jgi:hypothetical protein